MITLHETSNLLLLLLYNLSVVAKQTKKPLKQRISHLNHKQLWSIGSTHILRSLIEKMTRECDKQPKASWSKKVARKWLNIQSGADEFHSDQSIKVMLQRRDGRMSYSGENSCAIVPEEFSEEWLIEAKDQSNGIPDFSPEIPLIDNPLSLRLAVGTWNVGGNSPNEDLNLNNWLTTHAGADIYVLGFQEIVPLNAANVLGAEDSGPAAKWLSIIRQALNNQKSGPQVPDCYNFTPDAEVSEEQTYPLSFLREDETSQEYYARSPSSVPNSSSSEEDLPSPPCYSVGQESHLQSDYTLVASKQMVGLFLCVWVRSDLHRHIRNPKVSCVGRGIMGYLGNKGSISMSMTMYKTTFCFVCTHLASGQKEGDEVKRNMDVMEILKKTKFPHSCRVPRQPVSPDSILDHDKIIWLGDLNYRLASDDETNELLDKKDWQALLEKDQLKLEQRAGRIFEGWEEGQISFPPTYKYLTNSDDYVGQTYISKEKRRTPAWCDRILWKGGLKQISYERVESKFSDHRPVCSLFSVQVNAPNKF
ncbi:hypothetical protein ACET3Z_014575 [Daucus carota]